MEIHFISTLTPEDEDRVAPAVLKTVEAILEQLPIAYTLRIATATGHVFQHTKSEVRAEETPEEDLDDPTSTSLVAARPS